MADSSVAITAGSGTPIRVLTALGTGSADQQVVTVADPNGSLLGYTSTVATATAAAAAAVTLTLAAAGAGLFHYITKVRVERFCTAATTGANSGLLTGGTNHSLVFQLPSDTQAIGFQSTPVDFTPGSPIKTTTANTATTFTTPVSTATIYRITVTYYTAA